MLVKSYPINFLNYTKNLDKNQLLFIKFTKNDWLRELTNIDSNIYFFIKEEVEELFFKIGGYLIFIDFETCYKIAVEITMSQIKKSIKKNVKCFFEMENDDNLLIYKKVKERLVNNTKNLFDSKRKTNIVNFEIWIIDDIYENHEIDFTVRDLKKLAKEEPKLIVEHIRTLANNFELTVDEIKELSKKLDINLSHIIESDLSSQFKYLRKSTINNQLYLDFNEELMVA